MAWSPRLKLCPLLSPICTPQHQCLHWSWTHPNETTPPLLSGLNPFCHSHLSGSLTEWLVVCISECQPASVGTEWLVVCISECQPASVGTEWLVVCISECQPASVGTEWLVVCISECQPASVEWVHASRFKTA